MFIMISTISFFRLIILAIERKNLMKE